MPTYLNSDILILSMKHKRVIGQITIKRIGNCYAACISGTPQKILKSYREAEVIVEKLRKKHGRRHYQKVNNKKKCKKR